MKRAYHFQKGKFLALKPTQQHKKCAEFLDQIVKGHIELLSHYNELCQMLFCSPIASDPKELLDRLEMHLNLSGTFRKEHAFHVRNLDNNDGKEYLPITIYLDHLRSCHNIGSIVRTVEAFRLGEVVFSDGMAGFEHPQVQRSAMGACSWVTCRTLPLAECHRPLIAVETVTSSTSYYAFSFPDCFTLALGNEEYGLSDEVLQNADHCIQIPLYGRKNSLNVACAFAIVAGEIVRQKRIP